MITGASFFKERVVMRYFLRIIFVWILLQPALGQTREQHQNKGAWAVLAGSRVEILGKTNLNDFRCTAPLRLPEKAFEWQESQNYNVRNVALPIRVRSLNCGNTLFNEVMYGALQAKKFPNIEIAVREVIIPLASSSNEKSVQFYALVQLNGHTKSYWITAKTSRRSPNTFRVIGKQALKMTDFGVQPPVAVGGVVRTMNDLVIGFDILLSMQSHPD